MDNIDTIFYDTLTRFRGHPEPLHETVAVLSYEVGNMLEHAMYAKWTDNETIRQGHIGQLTSELQDAIAQCELICESIGVDFMELRRQGIDKAMRRFLKQDVKT